MATKDLPHLQKLAARYDANAAELQSLIDAEPKLRSDLESKSAALKHLPPDKLILLEAAGGEGFDKSTDETLRAIKLLRTKLEILPGCRARLEADLKAIAESIGKAIDVEYATLKEAARARLDALEKKLRKDLLPDFGGDETRARDGVRAMLDRTEAANWLRNLRRPEANGSPADRARRFVQVKAAFESGKPYKAA